MQVVQHIPQRKFLGVFVCYFTVKTLEVSLTNYDDDLFNETPSEMSRAAETKNLQRFKVEW